MVERPGSSLAPHVQAAVARAAQPKMPEPPGLPSAAAHVRRALAPVQPPPLQARFPHQGQAAPRLPAPPVQPRLATRPAAPPVQVVAARMVQPAGPSPRPPRPEPPPLPGRRATAAPEAVQPAFDRMGPRARRNQRARAQTNRFEVLSQTEDGIEREQEFVREVEDRPRRGRIEGRRRQMFEEVWSATQRHHTIPEGAEAPPIDNCDILIVSENLDPQRRTGALYPGTRITRTFYPGGNQPGDPEIGWQGWDWTNADDMPLPARSFDRIVARSMVCACEPEHFHHGELQGLCGGITVESRRRILDRVARLLRNHGQARAYLTVAPRLHDQGVGVRSRQRRSVRAFWSQVVSEFNRVSNTFQVLMVNIERGDIPVMIRPQAGMAPAPGHGRETQGEFFALVMRRRPRRRRRR